MYKKYKEYLFLGISVLVIVLVTGFPMFARGAGGDIWDMTYHLLRIESVKEAILNGDFPPRLSPIYFDGFGYGSSMFYPDIFLVIPALMNICGITLLLSYKMFMLLITVIAACTTYFSLKYISGDWKCALVGSYVLMLSNYYLADVNNRAGLSEYLAFIFVPLLVVGIYDYFARDGRKVYLMGVAFAGLALSHTIMTFIAVLLTIICFLSMLLIPGKRRLVFQWGRLWRLLLTALLTVLVVSYYVFPMLEQMSHDSFRYSEPWAFVGQFTQSFESFFAPVGVFLNTAQFGVGIPVLFLLASRVMLGRVKNRWADYFLILGVVVFLLTTNLIPWAQLEDTVFNMIQFTYRFYPYALFFVICGMTLAYTEKYKEGLLGRSVLGFVVVLVVVCGIWQNNCCKNFGSRTAISKEYVYENNHWVGKGEWVPEGVSDAVYNGQGNKAVITEVGISLPWKTEGYNHYSFPVIGDTGSSYVVPLIYYKGYRAEMLGEDGEPVEMAVEKNYDGLVRIGLPYEMDGRVQVWYDGTTVQRVSNWVSGMTVIGLLGFAGYRLYIRKKR